MSSSSVNTAYFLLTGVVLAIIIVAASFGRSQVQLIQSTSAAIADKQNQLAQQRQFLSTIDQKLNQLSSNAAAESVLAVSLPDEEATEDVIRIINHEANVSGLQINNIVNDSSQVQTNLRSRRNRGLAVDIPDNLLPLSFSLEATGTYGQMRAFLSQLERSPRFIQIENLTLRKQSDSLDQIEATLSLIFYQYDEEQ